MPDSNPVDFVLSDLSGVFQLNQTASILGEIPLDICNNTPSGMFNVRTIDMREVFQFKIDELQVDGTDTSYVSIGNQTDVRYYVNLLNWPDDLVINPSHAVMRDFANTYVTPDDATETLTFGGIEYFVNAQNPAFEAVNSVGRVNRGETPSNQLMIKHDFLRYIAKETFGTSQAVDLFNNEASVKRNLTRYMANFFDGGNEFPSTKDKTVIDAYDNTSLNIDISGMYSKLLETAGSFVDASFTTTESAVPSSGVGFYTGRGNEYDDNEDNLQIENYSRELLKQIAAKAPERFDSTKKVKVNGHTSAKYSLVDSSDPQPIPFQDGDSIQFTFTIKPSDTQFKNPKALSISETEKQKRNGDPTADPTDSDISGTISTTLGSSATELVPDRKYRIILRLVADDKLENIAPIDENNELPVYASVDRTLQFDSLPSEPNAMLLNYQFPYFLSFGRSPPQGFTGILNVELQGGSDDGTTPQKVLLKDGSTSKPDIEITGGIDTLNVKHFPFYGGQLLLNTSTDNTTETGSYLTFKKKVYNYSDISGGKDIFSEFAGNSNIGTEGTFTDVNGNEHDVPYGFNPSTGILTVYENVASGTDPVVTYEPISLKMSYDRVEGKFYPFIEDAGTTVSSTKYETASDGTITTDTSNIAVYGTFFSKKQYEKSLYVLDNTLTDYNHTDVTTDAGAITFTRPSYDTTGEENYVYNFAGFTDASHNSTTTLAGTSTTTTYTVDYNKRNVRPIRLLDSQGNFVRYVLKNCDGYFDGKYYNIIDEGIEKVDT
jgi:hypothetical protein